MFKYSCCFFICCFCFLPIHAQKEEAKRNSIYCDIDYGTMLPRQSHASVGVGYLIDSLNAFGIEFRGNRINVYYDHFNMVGFGGHFRQKNGPVIVKIGGGKILWVNDVRTYYNHEDVYQGGGYYLSLSILHRLKNFFVLGFSTTISNNMKFDVYNDDNQAEEFQFEQSIKKSMKSITLTIGYYFN